MHVSFYTKRQLQTEVGRLKVKALADIKKQFGPDFDNVKHDLKFSDWMIAASNNGVRLQINWHCSVLNGTESITL